MLYTCTRHEEVCTVCRLYYSNFANFAKKKKGEQETEQKEGGPGATQFHHSGSNHLPKLILSRGMALAQRD